MANEKTLLSELRARSAVDCDTLDVEGMAYIHIQTPNSIAILTL